MHCREGHVDSLSLSKSLVLLSSHCLVLWHLFFILVYYRLFCHLCLLIPSCHLHLPHLSWYSFIPPKKNHYPNCLHISYFPLYPFPSSVLPPFCPTVYLCLSIRGNDLIKEGFVACPLCIIASGVCLYFTQQLRAAFFCSQIS